MYLENQTVLLGRPAHFFCQFPGKYEDLRLSIDDGVIKLSITGPDLNLTIENTTLESVTVHSINITIKKEKQHSTGVLRQICWQRELPHSNSDSNRLGKMFIETHKLKYHILQEVQLRLSMEYQRTRERFSCPGLDHSPGGTTPSLATSLSAETSSQSCSAHTSMAQRL